VNAISWKQAFSLQLSAISPQRKNQPPVIPNRFSDEESALLEDSAKKQIAPALKIFGMARVASSIAETEG
jgi:hypothetical protein